MGNFFGFQKVRSSAVTPVKKTSESAGFDIFSTEEVEIAPLTRKSVNSYLRFVIPPNHFLFITNCSGNSQKGLHIGAGIVDSDFTGEVFVVVFNLDSIATAHLKPGTKIAQGILIPYNSVGLREIPAGITLPSTERTVASVPTHALYPRF